MAEGLILTLKERCIDRQRFDSIQHATRALGDWISFHGRLRPHHARIFLDPAEAFALAVSLRRTLWADLGKEQAFDEDTGKRAPTVHTKHFVDFLELAEALGCDAEGGQRQIQIFLVTA